MHWFNSLTKAWCKVHNVPLPILSGPPAVREPEILVQAGNDELVLPDNEEALRSAAKYAYYFDFFVI